MKRGSSTPRQIHRIVFNPKNRNPNSTHQQVNDISCSLVLFTRRHSKDCSGVFRRLYLFIHNIRLPICIERFAFTFPIVYFVNTWHFCVNPRYHHIARKWVKKPVNKVVSSYTNRSCFNDLCVDIRLYSGFLADYEVGTASIGTINHPGLGYSPY